MKKIFGVFAVVLVILMTTSSFASAAPSKSYFKYRANPPKYAVDPAALDSNGRPLGMPYCRGDIPYLICYPPSFIKTAYNFPNNLDGTGQTILIVDAFLSPTIAADLAWFDTNFGIPAPPSFKVICPLILCPRFDPSNANQVGWAIEETLDVLWAHAAAPGAKIVLVVAQNDQDISINLAESIAIKMYPGSIMSQSFGSPEADIGRSSIPTLLQAEANYLAAKSAHVTVLASSGDDGATTGGLSVANPSYPSSSTWNLAVGGTEGNPYLDPTLGPYSCAAGATCTVGLVVMNGGLDGCTNGTPLFQTTCTATDYGGEQVWGTNEAYWFGVATGGAISRFFAKPSYQSFLPGTKRMTSDVSLDAAINGGVLVPYSAGDLPDGIPPGTRVIWIVGGTSVSAPIWAGIIALVNQKHGSPVGFINPAIYSLARSSHYSSDFHDITLGYNGVPPGPGYYAGTGWDIPTGWGTPNVANFVNDIQAYV